MTTASAGLRTERGRPERRRRRGDPLLLAGACLLCASVCWGYVAHEVSPESITDPRHDLGLEFPYELLGQADDDFRGRESVTFMGLGLVLGIHL